MTGWLGGAQMLQAQGVGWGGAGRESCGCDWDRGKSSQSCAGGPWEARLEDGGLRQGGNGGQVADVKTKMGGADNQEGRLDPPVTTGPAWARHCCAEQGVWDLKAASAHPASGLSSP